VSQAGPSTQPSVWRTVKTVAWSFAGLRGRQGFEQDVLQIRPLHLLLVGFVGVLVFVGGLMALVHWIVPA
jgi:hypothetical protein